MRILISLFLTATFCRSQSLPAPVPKFEDLAARAGLTVSHISSPEKKYIVETVSGGVGFIDCDNDGRLDIVLANGSTIERYRNGGDAMVTLYHQDANLKFSDITKSAGLTAKGWGMGVAVGDFDNDGWQDLYVTGFGGNVLYRNLGNCKFEDVTEKSGLRAGGFGQGAAWGDYDRDGYIDLFVSRYLDLDINHLPEFGSKECTAARSGFAAKRIYFFAIEAMERLKTSPGRPELTILRAPMACSRSGSTTTMTAGLICMSRKMPGRTTSTTTSTMARSRT